MCKQAVQCPGLAAYGRHRYITNSDTVIHIMSITVYP